MEDTTTRSLPKPSSAMFRVSRSAARLLPGLLNFFPQSEIMLVADVWNVIRWSFRGAPRKRKASFSLPFATLTQSSSSSPRFLLHIIVAHFTIFVINQSLLLSNLL
jgi:hypothetical protein